MIGSKTVEIPGADHGSETTSHSLKGQFGWKQLFSSFCGLTTWLTVLNNHVVPQHVFVRKACVTCVAASDGENADSIIINALCIQMFLSPEVCACRYVQKLADV